MNNQIPNQPIYQDFVPPQGNNFQQNNVDFQQPQDYQQPLMQPPMMQNQQPIMINPQPIMINPQQQQIKINPMPMDIPQQVPYQRPQQQETPSDYRTLFGPRNRCLIAQDVDFLELFTNFEQEHHYKVTFGDQYTCAALEESSWFGRQFFGPRRPFTMHIRSVEGQREELLTIRRPFCWWLPEIEVIDPKTNTRLGKVESRCTCCSRDMNVKDDRGRVIYTIHGPCCNPWTFHIQRGGDRVGVIRKKWAGFLKEMLTTVENFGVEFPPNATARDKAVLFGATFLIDFMYFEHKKEDENDRRGGGALGIGIGLATSGGGGGRRHHGRHHGRRNRHHHGRHHHHHHHGRHHGRRNHGNRGYGQLL